MHSSFKENHHTYTDLFVLPAQTSNAQYYDDGFFDYLRSCKRILLNTFVECVEIAHQKAIVSNAL